MREAPFRLTGTQLESVATERGVAVAEVNLETARQIGEDWARVAGHEIKDKLPRRDARHRLHPFAQNSPGASILEKGSCSERQSKGDPLRAETMT